MDGGRPCWSAPVRWSEKGVELGLLHELASWNRFAARWCPTCTVHAAACTQPWNAGALFGDCSLASIVALAVLLESCSRGALPGVSQ